MNILVAVSHDILHDFALPSGTPFQLIVWEELQKIAYGETATYGQLAEVVAVRRGKAKMSAQAVGNALHKNPISSLCLAIALLEAAGNS